MTSTSLTAIDLNSDLGESFGAWAFPDEQMLSIVSSANIACGFHAGDPVGMRRAVQTAAERGVTVGAHIGYRDLAGFGRRFIDYAPAELAADVMYQLAALQGLAQVAGTEVRYVKPHGALYNALVHHRGQSRAVVDAVAEFNPDLPLLLLPGSEAIGYAKSQGVRVVGEAFADRAYEPDGTLVSRAEPDAVHHDVQLVVENMLRFVQERVLVARDGTEFEVEADSICVHGDTPAAAQMAQALREALTSAGVAIHSFV